MRTKDTLTKMDDIALLLQYLYMSPENTVTVNNGLTDLKIRMSDDCTLTAKNLSFPDLPAMDYTLNFTVPAMLGCIEYLKTQQPEMPDTQFKSRWDEIKTMTAGNLALNLFT